MRIHWLASIEAVFSFCDSNHFAIHGRGYLVFVNGKNWKQIFAGESTFQTEAIKLIKIAWKYGAVEQLKWIATTANAIMLSDKSISYK